MIVTDSPREWRSVLGAIPEHDFYHTYDYHQSKFGETDSAAEPKLLVYEEEGLKIALPIFLRRGQVAATEFVDATSAYGYAGPVLWTAGERVQFNQVVRFQEALEGALRSLGVVSLFSRLHPLIETAFLVEGLGDLESPGFTLSIDVTLPEEDQWRGYRRTLKRQVTLLRESDLFAERSEDPRDFTSFLEVYNAMLLRKGSGTALALDTDGLRALQQAEDFRTHLFVCRHNEEVAAAGLFVRCGDILQYHLSATHEAHYRRAPMKLLLDTVRRWATETGCKHFHLGGGLGAREDSLMEFKRAFSKQQHTFQVWKWTLDEATYDALASARANSAREGFFPAYRAPS